MKIIDAEKWQARYVRYESFVLVGLTILLLLWGLSLQYDAVTIRMGWGYENLFHRQLFGIVIAIGIFIFLQYFDLRKYLQYKWLWLAVAIVWAMLPLLPEVGITIGGARRWFYVFPDSSFIVKSSSLVTVAYLFFLAGRMEEAENYSSAFRSGKDIVLLIAAMASIFIFLGFQPDFPSVLILTLSTILFLLIHGRGKAALAVGIFWGAIFISIISSRNYRITKIFRFLDPAQDAYGSGYSLLMSFSAFIKGGFWGLSLPNDELMQYFPLFHWDFIFSLLSYRHGLFGVAVLMLAFLMMLHMGMRALRKTESRAEGVLLSACLSSFMISVFLGMAVPTGMFPTMGVTIPFFSFGMGAIMLGMVTTALIYRQFRSFRKEKECAEDDASAGKTDSNTPLEAINSRPVILLFACLFLLIFLRIATLIIMDGLLRIESATGLIWHMLRVAQ